MRAMILDGTYDLSKNKSPLKLVELPVPEPKAREVLVKVSVCGVCRTDLDEIEGRSLPSKFPIILGHQIVGRVEKTGNEVSKLKVGDRVGIAWVEFLEVAKEIPIRPEIQIFNLEDANKALLEIKEGKIKGAKVLKI